MSYVKSFKELARKLRCFSFAGAKVDTFHNMTKHSRNFFKEKRKNFKYTLYNIYIWAQKEGRKALLREIRRNFKPKKLAQKYASRNTEKKGVRGLATHGKSFFLAM